MKKPNLARVKLWQLCLLLLILANLSYSTHSILGSILTIVFFLSVPGYLLLRLILKKATFGAGTASLSIGLSLSLLTIFGLVLNSFHIFGLQNPLEARNILITLNALVVILLFCNRSTYVGLKWKSPHFTFEELLFGFFFSVVPILSILGAFRLNNGASAILTMIMIALVGVLFLALILRPTLPRVYPYAIFMTALAILLSISLRGWSITGHDIHHEFGVFNMVVNNGFWSPTSGNGDPYNACLSITILPTVIYNLTDIPAIYIFKAVFQVAFAALVPALYFFARRFTTEKKALLGIFAFMTFPTFINDLPFLNRQEIAFGYFILILLVNFANITYRAKSILSVILLLSIILSHYSTSYVTISILLLTLVLFKVLSFLFKNPSHLKIPILSLPIIIMTFLTTFTWNAQITASSSNLSGTLTSALDGITGKNQDSSGATHYGLLSNARTKTPAELLADTATSRNVSAQYVPAFVTPYTSLGKSISKVVDVKDMNVRLHAIIAKILQLLVVAGTVILAIKYRKKISPPKNIYFLAMCISFLVALVLFTFVPQLSIGYDVTRLFQQSMMVLWLPVIMACEFLFAWLGKKKLAASAFLLVMIYFNLSGFSTQLTGGYLPSLNLNNSGAYYDFFYTHRQDELGTDWLSYQRLKYMPIYMDSNAAAPTLKFPVAVGLQNGKSQGYYYTDYMNNTTGTYRTITSLGFTLYTNPSFTDKKSLVYNNGTSKIYFAWPSR